MKRAKTKVESPDQPPKKPRKRPDSEREQSRLRMKANYDGMSQSERSLVRWKKLTRPPKPRPGSARAKFKRNVDIAVACPSWTDPDEVVRLYMCAAIMSELTGVPYVVDHGVPLNHPQVCGLHSHQNLQVISEIENRMKSNTFWVGHDSAGDLAIEVIEEAAYQLQQLLLEQQQDRLEAAEHHDIEQSAGPTRPKRRKRRIVPG